MNPTFQYYGANIKEVIPRGNVTMIRFLNAIKYPKPEMKHTLQKIREAAANKDDNTKAILKQKLYFFTPAINCTYRNYESIQSFTGLIPLDFDKLPSVEYATEFKEYLFYNYPQQFGE